MNDIAVLIPTMNQGSQLLFRHARFFLQVAANFTNYLRVNNRAIQFDEEFHRLLVSVVITALNQRINPELLSTKTLAGIGLVPAQRGKPGYL